MTWTNNDDTPHQITVTGSNQRSEVMLKGQSATLVAASDSDLVRRVVVVDPGHGLTGTDLERARAEHERRHGDVRGPALDHRNGLAWELARKLGQVGQVVVLGEQQVALVATRQVGLVLTLPSGENDC